MKRFTHLLVVLFLLMASAVPAFANGNVYRDTVNKGAFTDLKFKRAAISGQKTKLIDDSNFTQSSTTASEPVLTLGQNNPTYQVLSFTCTSGVGTEGYGVPKSCPTYSTTAASKVGSIKVDINGVAGYIDVKSNPN